jgi:phosphoribosylglycinamide formyltransferase-1
VRIGVLISGTGSNLQALIDDSAIDVACVVSDRPGAAGIERARRAGIDVIVSDDEAETAEFLERHDVGLVVLAGYMRILSAAFVRRFSGRLMNVHPSLLPAFPGPSAVQDALAYGVLVTGVTVHLIDDDHVAADTGPIVLQEALAVSYDDRPGDVIERLHEIEHRLLPRAVRLFGAGAIEVVGRRVHTKDERLA